MIAVVPPFCTMLYAGAARHSWGAAGGKSVGRRGLQRVAAEGRKRCLCSARDCSLKRNNYNSPDSSGEHAKYPQSRCLHSVLVLPASDPWLES